jgi:hypothetical protein
MNEPKGKLRDGSEERDPTPHETGPSGGEVDEAAGGADTTTDLYGEQVKSPARGAGGPHPPDTGR